MSPETRKVQLEQLIHVPAKQVYDAFTNATQLREWFCDIATLNPRVGGRFFVNWHSGFYSAGEFSELEPGKKVSFTWLGKDEPGSSLVEVFLNESDGNTLVKLVHSGFGAGEGWDHALQESQKGWKTSLENLVSVLETGQDLRITRRPMMGIGLNDFNAEVARQLGVPVSEGVRIESTMEGMGARAAGLVGDDVLVEMAGHKIRNYDDLGQALNGRYAGDQVEVVFYRGSELHKTPMALSRRPLPDIQFSVEAVSGLVSQHYTKLAGEIDEFFKNVTEEEASFKPSPGEWSAKEVMAHLIHGERDGQNYTTSLIDGQEYWSDDYTGNANYRVRATVSAYPTLPDLIAELKRCYLETAALYANMPPDFPTTRKGSFWRLAYGYAQGYSHEQGHFEQMRESIQAARGK